jgi:chemotaxis protein CheD
MYDPKEKICGLAHVMLPEPNGNTEMAPGRFAPTAIELLIKMMLDAGARQRGMYARIAGGAAMFAEVLPTEGVSLGDRNVIAVKDALAKAAIPLQGEDVGGSFGRSVFLDAGDGSFLVRAVRRNDVLL